ncbi:MAG: PD40 domain-containing protein, partial [Hyphomicrobiaceae bacterium]|nr:PD40 domain-containing protein [Hyphomicrobiaceae bacterium]
KVSPLITVDGVVDRIVADENGLYVRRYKIPSGFLVPQPEEVAYIPLNSGEPRSITQLLSPQPRPGFGVNEKTIYLGERGKLWRIDATSGEREAISVSASIQMEIYSPDTAPKFVLESSEKPTSILDPRISPDGGSLIFTAAGFVWRQSLSGGEAERINDDDGFQWGPAAWSPDGKSVAYQRSQDNLQELRIVDLDSGATRTLITVDRSGRFEPAWSPDGKSIVYVGFRGMFPSLYVVDVASGQRRKLIDSYPRWMPRPLFSSDGQFVYYTDRNQVRRYSIRDGGEPVAITDFKGIHITDGTISPDGKWLAFRDNEEIWWVAHLEDRPITAESVRKLTDDGGLNYSFSSDSRAIIYSTGAKVWRHPIERGKRTEIP